MTDYPVHYAVDRPMQFTRVQLVIRIVAFVALGVLGLSFGMLFAFAYLALPVIAASVVAGNSAEAYVDRTGPRVVHALHWLAAVCAWAGLTTDRFPDSSPDETVDLVVEGRTAPTAASAMWRVLTGIPSAVVLSVLGWIGFFVWIWAALTILVSERVGVHAFRYLVGLQRWSVRLLAYQASLVDDYPPFSFADAPPSLPAARAAS